MAAGWLLPGEGPQITAAAGMAEAGDLTVTQRPPARMAIEFSNRSPV
jgi:hypothetical protein